MSRQAVLQIIGLRSGRPTEHDGLFLVYYDPNTPSDGLTATIITTPHPGKARMFEGVKEALDYWQQVATPPNNIRADGKPNRPLTAFNVVVLDVHDQNASSSHAKGSP